MHEGMKTAPDCSRIAVRLCASPLSGRPAHMHRARQVQRSMEAPWRSATARRIDHRVVCGAVRAVSTRVRILDRIASSSACSCMQLELRRNSYTDG